MLAFYGEALAGRGAEERAPHMPLQRLISQPHALDNPTTRTRWLWVSAM
jgi:hypothetical protein